MLLGELAVDVSWTEAISSGRPFSTVARDALEISSIAIWWASLTPVALEPDANTLLKQERFHAPLGFFLEAFAVAGANHTIGLRGQVIHSFGGYSEWMSRSQDDKICDRGPGCS